MTVVNLMECTAFQEALPGLTGSSDHLPLSKEMTAHLEVCPACRNEWEWATGISLVFQELPDPLPSPRLSQPIFEALYGPSAGIRESVKGLLTRVGGFFSVIPNFAPAFVVLFIAVGVGLALLSSGGFNHQSRSVAQILHPEDRFALQQNDHSVPVSGLLREVAIEPVAPSANLADAHIPSPFSVVELEKIHRERKEALLEQDADSLLMRGRRYKSMGRVDLALRDFETIFRFYPGYLYMGDVLMYRAQCLAFQGDYDRAIESLDTYLKKEPSKKGLIEPMIDQLKAHQRTE